MSAIIDAGENLMLDRQVSVAQTKTQSGRRITQKRGPTLYNLEVEVPPQKMNGETYYAIENEVITLKYGEDTFKAANITGKIGGGFTSVREGWTAATVAVNEKIVTMTATTTGVSTGDTITITLDGVGFTYTVVTGNGRDAVFGGLATLINNNASYLASYSSVTGAITITGVGAGDYLVVGSTSTGTGTYTTVNVVTQVAGGASGMSLTVDGVIGNPKAFDYVQFTGSTKVYQLSQDAIVSSGSATLTLNSPLAAPSQNNTSVDIGDNVSFNFALMKRPQTSYQPGGIVQYGTFKFEEVIE